MTARKLPALATLALLALLTAPHATAARDLTVVSWGGAYQDAQRKIYFEPFMKSTGTKLVEDSWNGGIGTLRAKVEGGNADWDVVQVESEELLLGCDDGLFEPMDFNAIGGKDAFLPAAVNECGVGAIVWSTALSYDGDKFGASPPKSWADFFDRQKFPGKRGLRKGPKYALEFALMGDGVAPADVYKVLKQPDGVDRAFKKLETIKKDIVWWEAGAQPTQLLASGEVVMTSAYNGRIAAANMSDKRHFKVVWPGHIDAVDSWVILKNSPNKEAGLKFIAFASDPKRQAQLPEMVTYGVTNKAASALINPEILRELPTSPENLALGVPIDGEYWVANIERLTERFNGWVAQ
jgi:putative spermidine/putrescine transport system substrate-binding protein